MMSCHFLCWAGIRDKVAKRIVDFSIFHTAVSVVESGILPVFKEKIKLYAATSVSRGRRYQNFFHNTTARD